MGIAKIDNGYRSDPMQKTKKYAEAMVEDALTAACPVFYCRSGCWYVKRDYTAVDISWNVRFLKREVSNVLHQITRAPHAVIEAIESTAFSNHTGIVDATLILLEVGVYTYVAGLLGHKIIYLVEPAESRSNLTFYTILSRKVEPC